jgi:hypothetical protein
MQAQNKAMTASIHVEDGPAASQEGKESAPDLKLGRDGLPLAPQPSDHKDDPLVSIEHQLDKGYSQGCC